MGVASLLLQRHYGVARFRAFAFAVRTLALALAAFFARAIRAALDIRFAATLPPSLPPILPCSWRKSLNSVRLLNSRFLRAKQLE